MSDSIPPLDPSLLGPLREADPAPAAVRLRARARLMAAIGGGPGGSGGASGGSNGGRGRLAVPRMPRAVAFVLGGVVGVGIYSALAPAPAPRVVYVDRIVPAPPAPPLVDAPAASAIPAAQVTSPAAASPVATSSRASQLSAERMLLDEARAALAQGDPERAIDRLERHRRAFATPLLGEERDAMWIQALVKAGRYAEARTRASAFRKHSPDSLFSTVVDSAIDSIP